MARQQQFALDYVDVAARIVDALASMPVGKRGPRTSMLCRALADQADYNVCWLWPGRIASNGYGLATRPGSRTSGSTAHRVVYELLFGPIAAGLQIDHLCHDPRLCGSGSECPHRRCVNPTHLGLATPRENTLRSNSLAAVNAQKDVCHVGHGFTAQNTYTDPRGRRACRTCQRAHWRRYAVTGKDAS